MVPLFPQAGCRDSKKLFTSTVGVSAYLFRNIVADYPQPPSFHLEPRALANRSSGAQASQLSSIQDGSVTGIALVSDYPSMIALSLGGVENKTSVLIVEEKSLPDTILTRMKRLVTLDILRGILLLMMIVDHSPSQLRLFTDQPLGFFTTAECFVFVSAFLAGMLFRRRMETAGFAAARSATIGRAWRIYRAHLLTLSFVFVIGSFCLGEFPGVGNLLDQYFKNPAAALVGSTVLLFRPPLLDILPMYIWFSLVTPLVFFVAQRWGWKAVIYTSLAVWLISQTRVRDLLVTTSRGIPYVELGPFDILAWQLIWISGLFLGQRFQAGAVVIQIPRSLRRILVVIVIGFLGWRWGSMCLGLDLSNQMWSLDKWHLGPLRLINFFAASWLISMLLKRFECWVTPLRPLAWIGQHMLPVFCCQICLSVLLIGLVEPLKDREPIASVLVIGQLLSAFLLAWLFKWIPRSNNSMAIRPRALATHRGALTSRVHGHA
jgi:hypothetical protein